MEFSLPMLQIPVNGSNMFLRYADQIFTMNFTAWVGISRVQYACVFDKFEVGPDIISYTADEMQFMSAEGVPAQRFTDYPAT